MINKKHNNRLVIWITVFLGIVSISLASFAFAESDFETQSDDSVLILEGIVRKVSLKNNSFLVKVSKGERLQILLSPQTKLIGIPLLDMLKKGARVKVWYSTFGEENRAMKVELLPELGC